MDRAPEIKPDKKAEIKDHELGQITPRKVSIPDEEIPESVNPNGRTRPIQIDSGNGLKYKRIKGKRVYIEKWVKI